MWADRAVEEFDGSEGGGGESRLKISIDRADEVGHSVGPSVGRSFFGERLKNSRVSQSAKQSCRFVLFISSWVLAFATTLGFFFVRSD